MLAGQSSAVLFSSLTTMLALSAALYRLFWAASIIHWSLSPGGTSELPESFPFLCSHTSVLNSLWFSPPITVCAELQPNTLWYTFFLSLHYCYDLMSSSLSVFEITLHSLNFAAEIFNCLPFMRCFHYMSFGKRKSKVCFPTVDWNMNISLAK